MNNKSYYKVGISGHRDLPLADIREYEKILKNHLLSLKQIHIEKELLILTPLADGADRLIAKVAHSMGILYDVLLPMPQELYIKDFSQESQSEFFLLLNQAHHIKTVKFYAANTSNLISKPSIYRDFQYRKVGREIVEISDEMIIMSDSCQNDKIGGTSDILRYAKSYGTLIFTIECDRLCA